MAKDPRAHDFVSKDSQILALSRALAAVLCFLALPSLAWVGLSGPDDVRAEDTGADKADSDDVPRIYFLLAGPNDGEPINCRLKLGLRTNYAERGSVVVLINERRLFERPLFQAGFWDEDCYTTSIELDVDQAGKLLGENFLHPDAGPVRITAQLYSPQGRFVSSFLWSGFVGKPWVELVGSGSTSRTSGDAAKTGGNNTNSGTPTTNSGAPGLELHPMSKDLLFLVVASSNRELLKLPPDDSHLLREGRLIDTGTFTEQKDGKFARTVVGLDSLRRFSWPQTYVVLWTYDARGAWKRSVVSQVILKP